MLEETLETQYGENGLVIREKLPAVWGTVLPAETWQMFLFLACVKRSSGVTPLLCTWQQ